MLYFHETSSHIITYKKAVELGLGYAFETPSIGSVQVDGGPGNKAGVIFSASSESKLIRYKPDLQVWEPYPGKDGLWFGYWKDNRPAPDDLLRRKPKDGHLVELCDGREWLIPVARAVDGTSPLPRALKNDGTNWLVGDVKEAFKDYFARACQLWDVMFPDEGEVSGEDRIITIAGAADLCVIALSINYRVSVAEVSLLELLDTETYTAVCKAVVDYPALEAMVKKNKIAEPQSSAPGDAD